MKKFAEEWTCSCVCKERKSMVQLSTFLQ